MKKREKFEVEIEKLAYGGRGLARIDNRVVFVDGALPGDRVLARVRKVKSGYIEARALEILKPSSLRQPAPCEHFGHCGGCKWQDLDYQRQIEFKRQQVMESLKQIGGVTAETVHPTIPSPQIFAYRNKMEFSFTDRRWLIPEELADPEIEKGFALGLHVPGSFDRVMHIQKCWLQDDMMNRILNFSQEYFEKSELPVFNLKTHEGQLRFLVIRKSFSAESYMVNIVTPEPQKAVLKNYAGELSARFPAVSSVINTVNRRVAQIAFGEEEYLLAGEKVIREKIGPFEFEISANSFFQTNPRQAENLYRTVRNSIAGDNSLIWDLYSGTGTIAMFLSAKASRVVGFELVESAVQDAYENCRKNGVKNCEFVGGDIRENLLSRQDRPDVIVCDPPRSGMHPEVVKAIVDVRPAQIVYVSCNPATMARDVKEMAPYYRIGEVQPVDMFPHTYHIESVVQLERI